MTRATLLGGHALVACTAFLAAASIPSLSFGVAPSLASPSLDAEQSRRLQAWIAVLIHAQLEQGPSPRWAHRDCAGLVRFAVAEALREHTPAWRQSMGLRGQRLPPEPGLSSEQVGALRHVWLRADGSRGAFVTAFDMIRHNSRPISADLHAAQPGDLLFFDLGDAQHLMVWMGRYVAYHTGRVVPGDTGLRAVRASELMNWKDTRWRPLASNPNFGGLYRLAFLRGSA